MSAYIRFDWAMKRLLLDKANFAVLEERRAIALNMKKAGLSADIIAQFGGLSRDEVGKL